MPAELTKLHRLFALPVFLGSVLVLFLSFASITDSTAQKQICRTEIAVSRKRSRRTPVFRFAKRARTQQLRFIFVNILRLVSQNETLQLTKKLWLLMKRRAIFRPAILRVNLVVPFSDETLGCL
jgi:hypothetical protein